MIQKVIKSRVAVLAALIATLCAAPIQTTAQTLSASGISSSMNYKNINVAQIPEATIKSYAEKIKDAA